MKKKNTSTESEIEMTEMNARTDRAALRQRLANGLRKVIGNPVIEEKELAAFDIVMSRREVLKLGGSSAMVAGLVAAGVPPTVWARRDPSLGVHPCEVGLTAEEQASVTKAVDISIGTELFQQTIYAEPVVSPQAVGTHAVIEGSRHRYRLQSALDSITPTEAQFLDKGHHWGPPELVQLEETTSGWELVHYRHPWSAREDGATADGLVRDVIMTAADGLSDPVNVLTISSPYNNFVTADGMSGAAYVIVVVDRDVDGSGFLCVGTGTWAMTASSEAPPEYPVEWKSMPLSQQLEQVSGIGLYSSDKYVDMGHTDPTNPAEYIPTKSTEHIALYYNNGTRVITLADNGTPGFIYLWIDMVMYPLIDQSHPVFATIPRLVHLETNMNAPAGGDSPGYRTEWLVFASNTKNSDGTYEFFTTHVGHDGSRQLDELGIWVEKRIYGQNHLYDSTSYQNLNRSRVPAPPQGVQLEYSRMFNVHSFYGTFNDSFVKLAHFEGIGLAVFALESNGENSLIAGHFPLALPDAAGIGEITKLSGGVSKFDGFRFLASDANGNLCLLRHRRAVSASTPYSAPIYGFNDAEGNPKLSYNFTDKDPFPAGVDANSNLYTLDDWIAASNMNPSTTTNNGYRNILLNAALAFATDETALSQATWLGNTYQAAYAPRRFPFDSAYVVIQRAQGGDTTDYSAYTMHNNMVTKTWHTRQIATQVLPKDPGLNESGEHYHATVTPVNAYGRSVSLQSAENANLVIEVRADAPTTVVDDTNNLYHDIDRYSSFMAAPDSASGLLALAVKAESFGLVLYARLVDTSGLTPSGGDSAILASTGTIYPWQSANLAAQAQQRMGNDGTDTVALLGDAAPLADTFQYISGDTLTTASQDGDWQFKGDFDPTQNPDNLANLATYLNTSGTTMVSASPNLSLAASVDGISIDPLTAVTAPTPGVSGGVRFTYPLRTVTPATAAVAAYYSGELGSIWSSISHALHDALHWLQNVESAAYDDLAEGAVELVIDADQITATVSADIMKAVNGVEQELNEVVTSIEEYASVVANVIVTIVEQSFLYKLIEDIMALIELLQHLHDIKLLAKSLNTEFSNILQGPQLIPADYSSWELFQKYFGVDNDLGDQMNNLDVSSVATEITTDVLDTILKNPINKVLFKILSSVTNAVEEELPSPPISFTPNQAVINAVIDDVMALETDLVTAFADLTGDVIGDAVSQIAADLANPQNTYKNLAAGLETLVTQIEDDVIQPILDWLDDTIRSGPSLLEDSIEQDPLITVELTALKDLLDLFGIGRQVNNSYHVSTIDAVFMPMAIVMWITLYTRTGKSIKSIDEIDSATLTDAQGLLATSPKPDLQLASLAVNFVATEIVASMWVLNANTKIKGESPPNLALFRQSSAFLQVIRRVCNTINVVAQDANADGDVTGADQVALYFAMGQLFLSLLGAQSQFASGGTGGGGASGGWPTSPSMTDILKSIGALSTVGVIGYNAIDTATSNPSADDIISVTGQSLARAQGLATFAWDFLVPADKDLLPLFLAVIATCPFGFVLQAGVVSGELGAGAPGKAHGSCPRNNGRGKKKGQL